MVSEMIAGILNGWISRGFFQISRNSWEAFPFRASLVLVLLAAIVPASAVESSDEQARAVQLFEAHKFSAARVIFRALVEKRPADPAVHYYLGRLAWWFDDEDEAVTQLERAAQLSPSDAGIQTALADAYGLKALNVGIFSKLGWAKRCLAAHEHAVQLDPASLNSRWGLFGYYCLAPAFAGGGYKKAEGQVLEISKLDHTAGQIAAVTLDLARKQTSAAFAEVVVPLDSTDFSGLYQIGRCAAESGEQLDRGFAALHQCLQLPCPVGERAPTYASVHFRLGNILEKQGKKSAAALEYETALRIEPDFRPEKVMLTN